MEAAHPGAPRASAAAGSARTGEGEKGLALESSAGGDGSGEALRFVPGRGRGANFSAEGPFQGPGLGAGVPPGPQGLRSNQLRFVPRTATQLCHDPCAAPQSQVSTPFPTMAHLPRLT